LLALVAILLVSRLAARAFTAVGQPGVVGEIVAGLVLGPSLLGLFFPLAQARLFPPGVLPYLAALAQVGVVLYMFLVGLDVDLARWRAQSNQVALITLAGITLPFALGIPLAVWLYPEYAGSDVSAAGFAIFLAVALSLTAFPVLARILAHCRMTHS